MIKFPCYFLHGSEGGLVTNPVDGRMCLCLFTSPAAVQRFKQATNLYMHGPEHVDLEVQVDEIEDRDGLIDRLTNAEFELAADGIKFISIDAVPGQPTLHAAIQDFIADLQACRIEKR